MDREDILKVIQGNINLYGGYDYYTANEIVKDLLYKLNIDYSEIDFTPNANLVNYIASDNEYSFTILDRKDDALTLLVTERGHWFDYYHEEDKIEIVKEIPKDYDKNEPYYSEDNPLNINDKFIYNGDLFVVDGYIYHDMSIFASRVVEVIEISTSDLEYDFDCGEYYFSYEEYCENIMNEMNDEKNF